MINSELDVHALLSSKAHDHRVMLRYGFIYSILSLCHNLSINQRKKEEWGFYE